MGEEGAFSGFFSGFGSILSDAGSFARDIFVAREERKSQEAREQQAISAAIFGETIGLEQFKLIALSVLGIAALILVTRRARKA